MVLRRRWIWGAAAFALVLVPLVSLVIRLPETYESTSTVLIERQQIPDELVRSTVTSVLEVRLQTISQEILSRSRLESTIARFGLYEDLKRQQPMEMVIEQMRKDVKFDLRGSDLGGATVGFTVGYRGRDAQKVALVANFLSASYIEENLKMRDRQASGTADFFRNQLEDLERKLQAQEQQLVLLKRRPIGGPDEQNEARLKTLSREYENTYDAYKSLAVMVRKSSLAESMEQRQKGEQFRVIEPALPSEEPIAPKRLRLYALAVALALAVAAVVILVPTPRPPS